MVALRESRAGRARTRRSRAQSLVAAFALALAVLLSGSPSSQAKTLKIGVLRDAGGAAGLFIGEAKGYFADEGLQVQNVYLAAAQPIAVATVSGDVDIGIAGLSAALYTLAAQGALKIVGGAVYAIPTIPGEAVVVSNHAYAAGLTSLKDMAGHSVGLTQIGSPFHYLLSILGEETGFDIKSIRTLPLQSFPNIASAVTGGQADSEIVTGWMAAGLVNAGDAKLLPFPSNHRAWQISVIVVTPRTANENGDGIKGFLRGYTRGVRDAIAAFVGPRMERRDGTTALAVLALLAKDVGQPESEVRQSYMYVDPKARLDLKDLAQQIAWYRSQNMIKTKVELEDIIDRRYVVPMANQ